MKSSAQRAKLTWNANRFEALERIRAVLLESEFRPLYASYIAYLELRERGLRKRSFAQLDAFIEQIASDPFEVRLSVVRHLVGATEEYWDNWPAPDNWQFPEQISRRLTGPLWREWQERDPANPEAWLHGFDDLSRGVDGREVAFLLDPTHPRYQYAHLNGLCAQLNHELHELEHVETILCTPEHFGKLAGSVSAVAAAIGGNMTEEVARTPVQLNELAAIYRSHKRDSGTFLRELLRLGRKDLVDFPILPARRWFRVLPHPLG
ncbi:hypothetical protein [Mesorhizobium japonicum]|uniref:Mlr3960 protein n=1 Tax=Mesorhizobium japonicum (strain LMG 29417 / CECT 9101 / MAFF 303099) TaxID=266835 RepID=Q98F35_RHILO|nr:hypothetical protein [Mesorhizobium japonicum]BAB50732.1 mlr3960 [Mesorhizobium japonicum MAFF 303099]